MWHGAGDFVSGRDQAVCERLYIVLGDRHDQVSLADVFADPQVLARNMYVDMPHPTLGSIKQTGLPIKFSLTPGGLDRHPPLLGEHNQEILKSLGYSDADVLSLKDQSVI